MPKTIKTLEDFQKLRLKIAKPQSDQGAWISDEEFLSVWNLANQLSSQLSSNDQKKLTRILFDFTNHYAGSRVDPYRDPKIVGKILSKINQKKLELKEKDSNQVYQTILSERFAKEIILNDKLMIKLPQYFEKPTPANQSDPWVRLRNGCGIAVLTMVVSYINHQKSNLDQLANQILTYAKENNLTIEGEFFDIEKTITKILNHYSIKYSLHNCFLKKTNTNISESYDSSNPEWEKSFQKILETITNILDQKNIPIIAFDVDTKGNPIKANGLRSHFTALIHYFTLNQEYFFIAQHGWAEQGYHSKADITLYHEGKLKGYHIWNSHELISSMLGLNDTAFYLLNDDLLSDQKYPSLEKSHTIIGKNAGWNHTGKDVLAGKIIEVIL